MNFEQLSNEYARLRSLKDSGQMTPEQFSATVGKMQARDQDGLFWSIDPSSGSWQKWDGTNWILKHTVAHVNSGNAPTQTAVKSPETLIQLFVLILKSLPKAILKNLPMMIGILLVIMVAHTYLTAVLNEGFNADGHWLRDYLFVLDGKIISGALFMMLLTSVVPAIFRKSKELGGFGNFITELSKGFNNIITPLTTFNTLELPLIVAGFSTATILSWLWQNYLVSLQLFFMLMMGLIAFNAASLLYTVARLGQSDGYRLFNRQNQFIPISLRNSNLLFGGMALGMLITALPYLFEYGIFIGIAAAIWTFILFNQKKGRSTPSGSLTIFFLTAASWVLLNQLGFADDCGKSELGEDWPWGLILRSECAVKANSLGLIAGLSGIFGWIIGGIINNFPPIPLPPDGYFPPEPPPIDSLPKPPVPPDETIVEPPIPPQPHKPPTVGPPPIPPSPVPPVTRPPKIIEPPIPPTGEIPPVLPIPPTVKPPAPPPIPKDPGVPPKPQPHDPKGPVPPKKPATNTKTGKDDGFEGGIIHKNQSSFIGRVSGGINAIVTGSGKIILNGHKKMQHLSDLFTGKTIGLNNIDQIDDVAKQLKHQNKLLGKYDKYIKVNPKLQKGLNNFGYGMHVVDGIDRVMKVSAKRGYKDTADIGCAIVGETFHKGLVIIVTKNPIVGAIDAAASMIDPNYNVEGLIRKGEDVWHDTSKKLFDEYFNNPDDKISKQLKDSFDHHKERIMSKNIPDAEKINQLKKIHKILMK